MAQAKSGDTVRVHYSGKLDDGTVFDTSEKREPLEFTIGGESLIAGFEQAVIGMEPGERKTQRVPSDEAYGPFRNELVHEIQRSQFPEDADLSVGQRFRATAGPETIILSVVDIGEEQVTVDANHPLAGKDLVFEIELVEIL